MPKRQMRCVFQNQKNELIERAMSWCTVVDTKQLEYLFLHAGAQRAAGSGRPTQRPIAAAGKRLYVGCNCIR